MSRPALFIARLSALDINYFGCVGLYAMKNAAGKSRKISERRRSVASRMRNLRHKKCVVPNAAKVQLDCVITSQISGTSSDFNACRDDENMLHDDALMSDSSIADTSAVSALPVDTCISTYLQDDMVVDTSQDYNIENMSPVKELCEDAAFQNEMHMLNTAKEKASDNVSISRLSCETFSEIPQHVHSPVHFDAEDVQNDADDEIDNVVLHVDGNIDAGHLRSAEIAGRSIVDFGHVFAELQRLSKHWIGECRFSDLVITKTKRYGLQTQYFVECKMCHFCGNFWSEPQSDEILDMNTGAVGGTILTGIGHKQLDELLAAMDVPCMSNKTYLLRHDEISEAFAGAAQEEMKAAGEEEKRLAIERGDLIDGVPHIPVITDGSWMKRSYRSGSYDSPSGAAIITGWYSRKATGTPAKFYLSA